VWRVPLPDEANMIDISRTRESMMAEIGASGHVLAQCLSDPSNPAFLRDHEAYLVLSGTTREQILPHLQRALGRRFSTVPPERFIRDLGLPLKRGLGNAYRWGNGRDPAKRITTETVVTERGAVVAISDEGAGFEVESTVRRFREHESHARNRGGGFEVFEDSASAISYADGGRTMLIRFLCPEEGASELAYCPTFMKTVFHRLPMVRKHPTTLESCSVEKFAHHRPGQPEARYTLETRPPPNGGHPFVMTGRILSVAGAETEYRIAKALYKGPLKEGDSLRVVKPMRVRRRHPRLVLYPFDSSTDFGAWLDRASTREEVTAAFHSVGEGLRRLHQSDVSPPPDDTAPSEYERRTRAATNIISALAESPDLFERVRGLARDLERLAESIEDVATEVLVHGSFGWECILRVQNQFCLYRFDEARRSHPGLDVGGFLADIAIHEATQGAELADARHTFLDAYFARESPRWLDDLPFFTAAAILPRIDRLLQRPPRECEPRLEKLLATWERQMTNR
jgi:hypothetical protein